MINYYQGGISYLDNVQKKEKMFNIPYMIFISLSIFTAVLLESDLPICIQQCFKNFLLVNTFLFKISNHCDGVTLCRLQRLSSTIAAVRRNFYLEYIVHDNTCQILSHIYCRLTLSYYLKDFFGRNMDVTFQKF